MFWGTLFASILLGSVFGVIVFLCMWQVTAAAAQAITASLIGTVLAVVLYSISSRMNAY